MENQNANIATQEETQDAAFCAYCGAKVEATAAVCMSCGCPVNAAPTQPVVSSTATKTVRHGAPTKKSPWKWILLGVGALVLVAVIVVVALFVVPEMREAAIRKQLAGETFTYYERSYYSYSWDELDFLDEEEVKYSYYYSSIDTGNEYTCDYEIVFEGDDAFIVRLASKYKIEFDGDEIESLYDVKNKERYEKE